ncbi:Acetyltransferase (GNAT) domain-containing protein [Desulfocicer vacuolatum DSM 3385]|uniref:Acetyltransferase (GNAT) domain-containing protein n=1 Tax=Desulfocicer vacuolatum DSM 3385 TaxID=1121400 RepID=A0A1W2ETH6_9BACT|nr:GNAT family N-acetyltransferase [Desulfocicer vacuolatum]SMD12526.1 Acetyltransferase (GNAT) domain-containing protein [Desulfocicer vacuolatum DSM 3385]
MMITVQLDKNKHDRNRFDCGVNALNAYLKVMANQQSKKDNTRTFVLEDENKPKHIIGYYTLTMAPINLELLPNKLQKKHHNAGSGGLIARLAVDKRYKKQGYGEWLLIDALKKLLLVSETVGFPLVIVDAKDGSIEFYEKFGFMAFQDTVNKLFLTMADIRVSLT